ncbi:MAG: glycosyltransferase family 1 protein [Candidatus Delongbacteria bacterium]|nr:glycosyltransferase family 1 protein [Candidatus Delongbacteria bacterium]MBN2833668.1 glycosyltransferase family 1 protein [Candidatus Delongbacteria bacterium]
MDSLSLCLKIPKYKKFSSSNIRVLLFDDGNFIVGHFAEAFVKKDYAVEVFKINRIETIKKRYFKSFTKVLEEFKPDLIFSINFSGFDTEGSLSALLNVLQIRHFCYFIDHPTINSEKFKNNLYPFLSLFVPEKRWINTIATRFGTIPVYLPLAYNSDIEKYKISSSLAKHDFMYHGYTFLERIEELSNFKIINGDVDPVKFHNYMIAKLLDNLDLDLVDQIEEFEKENETELYFDSENELNRYIERLFLESDLFFKNYVLDKMTKLYINIYGDEKWRSVFPDYNKIFNAPTNHKELIELYNSHRIILNIKSRMLPTGISNVFFEGFMSGSYVLAEPTEDIESIYRDAGIEAIFKISEVKNEVSFLLANEKEYYDRIGRVQDVIKRKHTYLNRVDVITAFITNVIARVK